MSIDFVRFCKCEKVFIVSLSAIRLTHSLISILARKCDFSRRNMIFWWKLVHFYDIQVLIVVFLLYRPICRCNKGQWRGCSRRFGSYKNPAKEWSQDFNHSSRTLLKLRSQEDCQNMQKGKRESDNGVTFVTFESAIWEIYSYCFNSL